MCQLITTIENKILNELNGEKLNVEEVYSHIDKYFNKCNTPTFLNLSPAKLQCVWTEIHIPDECFYGFYLIPTKKTQDYNIYFEGEAGISAPKEYIICIGSYDGITADFITNLIPPYVSIEQMDKISTIITTKL